MNEKWIPVADGLPEQGGYYWVTMQSDISRFVMRAIFDRVWDLAHPEWVVAWRPVEPEPEPYLGDVKEGQDESE